MRAAALAFLLVTVVLGGCTSNETDADRDTMPRSAEARGWDVVVDLMDRRIGYHVDSDPEDFDSDDDGLSDYDEFIRGLDPRNPDTDGDGLTDCQEAVHSNRTECEDPSFDGEDDGGTGTDPLAADSDAGRSRYAQTLPFEDETGTLPLGRPRVGDGLSDGEEVLGIWIGSDERRRFVQLDPRRADTDGDFLDDGAEVHVAGSDPLVPDSDGDGCVDGLDAYPTQAEHYDAGLETFTLHGEQSEDVRLRVLVVDHDQFIPAQDGATTYTPGQTTDLPAASPATLDAALCNYSIWDPWTFVEVQATVQTEGGTRFLDISSHTVEGQPRVWWDVRAGTLSLERDGEPLPAPARLEGDDGAVTFSPRVLLG